MGVRVDASCVVATTVSVDAATRDEDQLERNSIDCDGRNDLHEAEDGDRNQISRQNVLKRSERSNDRRVEHEHGIH